MKDDVNQEKKARQRLETVNLKLVNELADKAGCEASHAWLPKGKEGQRVNRRSW